MPLCERVTRPACFFLAAFIGWMPFESAAQLQYVPPLQAHAAAPLPAEGLILLDTRDFHFQYGAPARYPSTLQVIDPAQPWPPVFFANVKPGGEGLLGNGLYQNFHYHENHGLFSFYVTVTGAKHPTGYFVLCDGSLHPADTVHGAKRNIDSHDFQMNDRGERMYYVVADTLLNLAPLTGHPEDSASLVTSTFIEITDRNGAVVFYWDPLEHIPLTETYRKYRDLSDNNPFTRGWDWQHGNSLHFTHDGDITYSFRFLGVGKIDRETGNLLWKLGGKAPDIRVPRGGEYYLQHDFQEIAPGRYSIFSNGGKGERPCKAFVYHIDEHARTATLVHHYEPVVPVLSISYGNYETASNGLCAFNYGKYAVASERQDMFEIVDTSGRSLAVYSSPSLNFAYRVQYVPSLRMQQPEVVSEGGVLKLRSPGAAASWYRIMGTEAKHIADGATFSPAEKGAYVAVIKHGFGWMVSKTYIL